MFAISPHERASILFCRFATSIILIYYANSPKQFMGRTVSGGAGTPANFLVFEVFGFIAE